MSAASKRRKRRKATAAAAATAAVSTSALMGAGAFTLATATAATVFVLLPAPAHAQTQAPTNIVPPTKAFDIFVGQNKPGPYELSWQKIVVDDVKVVMDGATLNPGGFSMDAEKGTITFAKPVKNGAVVRVDYGYFPDTAVRNTKPAAVPITVPLLRVNDSTSLQVTALPSSLVGPEKKGGKSQSDKTPGSDKPLLVVNLGGKSDLLGGGLTSSAYLAPTISDADGQNGTLTDRLAVNLGYKSGTDKSGVEAAFVRTGNEIATNVGKTLKLGDATQLWKVGGKYQAASWLGAQYATQAARDLNGNGSTEYSTLGLNLGGVGNAPTLNLARTEDIKTTANDEATKVTTDKVDLAAKVGTVAEIKAQNKTVATDAFDDKKDVTAKESALALSTKVGTVAQITANGKIQDTKAADDKQDKTTQEGTIAVSASTKDKTAQISVAVTQGKTETLKAVEQKQGISVTLQPAPALKVTAEQKENVVTPIAPPVTGDGTGDSKAATPPAANDPALQTKETTVQSAKAEVTPLKGTIVTGTYQMNANNEKKVSIMDVNAELGKGAFLSVTGGITDRRTTDEDNAVLDTTRAKVALKPVSGLTLSGGMVINPADDKGKVTESRRQELGLAAKVGTFEVGGGYAIMTLGGKDDAFDQPQSGELSVNMALRFNRFAKLDGSYKDSFLYGADTPTGVRVYSLGFTHTMGSALSFSLGGKMTEDKSKIERPLDGSAEAKFNLKF